jgi:AraC-like DNA-binding protein
MSPSEILLSEPGSDLLVNLSPVDRILRRSSLFGVGEHRCPPEHPLFRHGGGPQTCPYIVFMRSTVIRVPGNSKTEVHTPNSAGFAAIGSSYMRRSVDGSGDHNDWIAISPAFLGELMEDHWEADPQPDGNSFFGPFAPVTLGAYAAQRHLMESLNSTAVFSDLYFEEYVIRVVNAVLGDAFKFWRMRSTVKRGQRPACERQRVTMVEAVKQRIASEYWSNQSLAALARSVHCSAGQLARIFPAQTGFSIHDYQQHMRLRMSLQLVRETPFELSHVATQLGFASHSHFSTVFGRKFGMSPSQFAKSRPGRLENSFLELLDQSLLSGLERARARRTGSRFDKSSRH